MDSIFGQFDMAIFAFNGAIQNDFLTFIAKLFSACGNTLFWAICILFGLFLCLFKKTRKAGFLICFCVIVVALLSKYLLNPLFGRLRPYNALQSNAEYFQWYLNVGAIPESEYSFPSKHVAVAVAVVTSLFYYIKVELKKNSAWILVILAVLIAWSRNYLMVHYATDIIAGAILGVLIGLLALKVYNLISKKIPAFTEWDFGKKIGRTIPTSKLAIVVSVLIIVGVSFAYDIYQENGGVHRCEFEGKDYICCNKAEDKQIYNSDKDKLEYRCKLHDHQ